MTFRARYQTSTEPCQQFSLLAWKHQVRPNWQSRFYCIVIVVPLESIASLRRSPLRQKSYSRKPSARALKKCEKGLLPACDPPFRQIARARSALCPRFCINARVVRLVPSTNPSHWERRELLTNPKEYHLTCDVLKVCAVSGVDVH